MSKSRTDLEAAILTAKANATAGYQLARYYDDHGAPVSAETARESMDDALDRLLTLWLGGEPA